MRTIRFSTIFILVLTLFAAAVFWTTFQHAAIAHPGEPEISVAQDSSTTSESGIPERLIIPALSVDAAVQRVGIGKSGNMAVPTNYTDVGWYKYGAKPGEQGNAVFDGHLDNGFGNPGVFRNLHTLNRGDLIYVKTIQGIHVQFAVTNIERVDANTLSTDTVFDDEGKPKIKLITCEGDWDPQTKTYSERLIVTAEVISN
jgi:sortase A